MRLFLLNFFDKRVIFRLVKATSSVSDHPFRDDNSKPFLFLLLLLAFFDSGAILESKRHIRLVLVSDVAGWPERAYHT